MEAERSGLRGNALLFKIAKDQGYVTEEDIYWAFPFAEEDVDAFELAVDTMRSEQIKFLRANVASKDKPLAA